MKILFAVQGTGNGHLSRATQIYPSLTRFGQVDVLISGTENAIRPNFPVRYRYDGLGFAFGQKGGIDIKKTYADARIWRFLKSVEEVPVKNYDLVINDFEPITAWACRLREIPLVALSHQSSLLKAGVPKLLTPDLAAELVLRHYAPAPASVGYHFEQYHPDIFTPVIRHELYAAKRNQKSHITVYLPAFSVEKLSQALPRIRGLQWHVFSRHEYQLSGRDDIRIFAVDAKAFVLSMSSASGVLCGAGFETPAEALHLGIPLMVVPMRGQYEQACNAAALEKIGAGVIWKTSDLRPEKIKEWAESQKAIKMEYPNVIEASLERLMELYETEVKYGAGLLQGLRSLLAG